MASGGSKQTNQGWSESGPEKWVRQEGEKIFRDAKGLVATNPTYKPYAGEGVASFDPDMLATIKSSLSGLMGGNADYGSTRSILDALRGTVDPSKGVQDYMSDYTGAALDPTIRKIRESGQLARNQIDSQATMSGAFGDAAQGVMKAQQYRDESQSVGDATATAYDKAFTNAQSARAAELARLLGVGQQFQSLGGAEAGQKAQATNFMDALMQQLQGNQQAKNTFDFNQWQTGQQYPYQQMQWLQQMLRGTPYQTEGANGSVSKGQDNSAAGLGGQLLGGILGGNAIPGFSLSSLFGGLGGAAGGAGAGTAASAIGAAVGL